jgi:cytidyltransferase-like protein
MLAMASVHGRFQPFHNGHLEYALAAKKRCDFLWIGITKFDITPAEFNLLGRPRELPENNPLTFYERVMIISAAFEQVGIERGAYGFVPFPIETPNRLSEFLPPSVPCFTTVCEDWNKEKIAILKRYGYTVNVLWERPTKTITGSRIREDIISGGDMWRTLVPPATARAVDELKIKERLLKLRSFVMDLDQTHTEKAVPE